MMNVQGLLAMLGQGGGAQPGGLYAQAATGAAQGQGFDAARVQKMQGLLSAGQSLFDAGKGQQQAPAPMPTPMPMMAPQRAVPMPQQVYGAQAGMPQYQPIQGLLGGMYGR